MYRATLILATLSVRPSFKVKHLIWAKKRGIREREIEIERSKHTHTHMRTHTHIEWGEKNTF